MIFLVVIDRNGCLIQKSSSVSFNLVLLHCLWLGFREYIPCLKWLTHNFYAYYLIYSYLNCMLLNALDCTELFFLHATIQVITIGREKYMIGEALFQPSILGLEANGIVEQLVHSISTVSSENHRQLLENTVLCGGTSCMTGESRPRISQLLQLA